MMSTNFIDSRAIPYVLGAKQDADFIKPNVIPYWLSYKEKEADTIFKRLVPYFVGNLDKDLITIEQMKLILNNHHPVVNNQEPNNNEPTVMFKLSVTRGDKQYPVLLTDWQVLGKPNKPTDAMYWSVFSEDKEALWVLKWKIEDYKQKRLERLRKIEKDNQNREQERYYDELYENALIEQHENRPKRNPMPLLWGNDFDTVM